MNKKAVILYLLVGIITVVTLLNIVPDVGITGLIFNSLVIIAGFVLLIKGADIFVDGASKLATKFNIPQMVIGLTIVAMGTSLPEAAVSIKGALSGNAGITIGNVIGSNILNVLLILGVSSVLAVLTIKKNTLRFEIPFVIIITILLLFLGYNGNSISMMDAGILLIFFIVFMLYLVKISKNGNEDEEKTIITEKDTIWKLLSFIVIGVAFIVLGSNITVESASFIASKLGMSNRLIGLTIVALGTSLPELVTSATAAKRGKVDIAIGNIVGSNIFNILFVIGICGFIIPIPFAAAFVKDAIVAIFAAVLLLVFVVRDKKLTKIEGVIMICALVAYITYIIATNYI